MTKITLIGDSITEYNWRAEKNWPMYLEENTDLEIVNLGISGTGFYKKDPYINRIDKVDEDTDLIGVAVSFNDIGYGSDIELGDFKNIKGGTLAFYVSRFFEKLIEKFPTTPIIAYIQNPWGMLHKGAKRSDNYVNDLREYLSLKGVPFYDDMYTKGSVLKPWIKENREKYFKSDNTKLGDVGQVDDVHPNSKGHKVIYNYLSDVIKDNLE